MQLKSPLDIRLPKISILPSLGVRKKDDELTYATMSGRMFALTIDMLLLTMLLHQPFIWISNLMFGHIDLNALSMHSQALVSGFLNMKITWDEFRVGMWQSGLPQKLLFDYSVQILISGCFIIFSWYRYATSPGKMLLGMYIADAKTGGKPTLGQLILRYAAAIISIGMMGAAVLLLLLSLWTLYSLFTIPAEPEKQQLYLKLCIAGVVVSLLMLLGHFWIVFDRRNQSLHDKFAGTVVLKRPSKIRRYLRNRRGTTTAEEEVPEQQPDEAVDEEKQTDAEETPPVQELAEEKPRKD